MGRFKVTYTLQVEESSYGSYHSDINTVYVKAKYKDDISLVLTDVLGAGFEIHEIIEVFR